ncbi:MAG: hypothetical protein ACJ79M_12995 [Myxococcales bacterium]
MRALPFFSFVALCALALLFDLTLRWRLPTDSDWAEVAASLRVRARPGDEVQVWPPWAERVRLFVESVPVRAEEDLRSADYPGVERLWLVGLFRSPRNALEEAREALRARGATTTERIRFGALELEEWDLHAPKLLADLTGRREEHEVDYVSRPCVSVRLPGRIGARGPGGVLHVRAGVVGERAYQMSRRPVRVEIRIDGVLLGELPVPPTVPPEPGWRRIDVTAPPGDHSYDIAASAPDTDRPFCVAAWVTDR